MTEFVLVLPFLAIITALTFFFGWALMHKHQVVTASRYSAWRKVEAGTWPTEEELNEICFNNQATEVGLSPGGEGWETARDLADEAGAFSAYAEELAERLVLDRFPKGRRAHVSADFGRSQAFWQNFTGAMHSRHGREGITWRRDEVRCWSTLRDLYYHDLDESLRGVNGMAEMIRRLYLAPW